MRYINSRLTYLHINTISPCFMYRRRDEDQHQHTTLGRICLGVVRCTERRRWCNRIPTLRPFSITRHCYIGTSLLTSSKSFPVDRQLI